MKPKSLGFVHSSPSYTLDMNYRYQLYNALVKKSLCASGSSKNCNVKDAFLFEDDRDVIVLKLIKKGGKKAILAPTDMLFGYNNDNQNDHCHHGRNALHLACLYNSSTTVLHELIDVGGPEAVLQTDDFGSTVLHFVFSFLISIHLVKNQNEYKQRVHDAIQLVQKLLQFGGKELIRQNCSRGRNVLFTAILSKAPLEIVELLFDEFDVEKKEDRDELIALMLEKDNLGSTVLNKLLRMTVPKQRRRLRKSTKNINKTAYNEDSHRSMMLMQRILEVCGKDALMGSRTYGGWNILHNACSFNVPIQFIKLFTGTPFGYDLVMQKDNFGSTPLLLLSDYHQVNSFEIVKELVRIGGLELVMHQNDSGLNILHKICKSGHHDDYGNKNNQTIKEQIVHLLLDVGGKELALSRSTQVVLEVEGENPDNNNNNSTSGHLFNSLHYASSGLASSSVIRMLIEVGGIEILTATNDEGHTALQHMIANYSTPRGRFFNRIIHLLVEYGIEYDVAEPYSVGGLFCNSELQRGIINAKWSLGLGTLVKQIDDIYEEGVQNQNQHECFSKQLPLLHAVVHCNLSQQIIQDVARHSNCVYRIDSFGFIPIELAIKEGIKWDQGLKDIVQTLVEQRQKRRRRGSKLCTAAQYGLQWTNGMKEVAQEDMNRISNVDEITGLNVFMLAAAGDDSDLTSVYELLLLQPHLANGGG